MPGVHSILAYHLLRHGYLSTTRWGFTMTVELFHRQTDDRLVTEVARSYLIQRVRSSEYEVRLAGVIYWTPFIVVVLPDYVHKGYHLVAARPIAKGAVVFADERRPFPIITRPYVEANWSDAETFSR